MWKFPQTGLGPSAIVHRSTGLCLTGGEQVTIQQVSTSRYSSGPLVIGWSVDNVVRERQC